MTFYFWEIFYSADLSWIYMPWFDYLVNFRRKISLDLWRKRAISVRTGKCIKSWAALVGSQDSPCFILWWVGLTFNSYLELVKKKSMCTLYWIKWTIIGRLDFSQLQGPMWVQLLQLTCALLFYFIYPWRHKKLRWSEIWALSQGPKCLKLSSWSRRDSVI